MYKVSIIIPIYNVEQYLVKCLDSVVNQTMRDIEIIVVNDCSTDNSLEILEEYASKDERIKIIDLKENQGAAIARNKGLEVAKGEYLGFVDSDDYVDLDFYEKLYNEGEKTGADAIKGTMNCIGSDNTIAYDRNSLIKKNFAYFYDSFTTAIYKTSFIKNNNILFPININYFEDPYFSILACLKYKKVTIVDSANYYYVNRLNSLVNSVGSLELTNGISAMLEMSKILNKETIIKENYTILYTYIISQLTLVLSNIKCSQQVADKANEYLFEVISECKYKKECLANYFEMKRFIRKKSYTNILKKKIQRG